MGALRLVIERAYWQAAAIHERQTAHAQEDISPAKALD